MNRRSLSRRLLLGASLTALLVSAAPERKVRVDIAAAPLRSGTVLIEGRLILSDGGSFAVTSTETKETQSVTPRYNQRIKLKRRIQSAENEDVVVEDHAEDAVNYFGTPPAANEMPAVLNQEHLHARKKQGLWLYDLQDRKVEPRHATALNRLGWITGLLDMVPVGVGTQQRTTGETWKTDFTPPRGKAKGIPILKGYECTLEGVEDVQGVPHARIAVRGELTIEQPTYSGNAGLTFSGSILRRLKDKVDVEMQLKGDFTFTGPVTDGQGKPATLALKMPYTLSRTLRVEPR